MSMVKCFICKKDVESSEVEFLFVPGGDVRGCCKSHPGIEQERREQEKRI